VGAGCQRFERHSRVIIVGWCLTCLGAGAFKITTVILNTGRGQNLKFLPYAFTEHGAVMAATILNSPRAVEMSIFVVRAFVQLRELLGSNKELARRSVNSCGQPHLSTVAGFTADIRAKR
jgi:hypothetical protein